MAQVHGTMKALVKRQPTEGYELVEIPIPQPAAGELLVKITRVSICGSDINLFKWNEIAQTIAALPFTPGHEAAGTIAALGPGVDPNTYKIGAVVGVENHYYCGECYQCTHDQPHICAAMKQYGHGKGTIHGGFSQYSIVPAKFAYVMKTALDGRLACLLEPVGVAHHAVEEVEVKNSIVLVTGCGPIGLFSCAIAKVMGATKVIASDMVASRLAIAKQMHADVVVDTSKEDLKSIVLAETKGAGADCLIECSGAMSVINNFYLYLRKGGRVLLLGLPKQPIHIENPLPNFIFKSITLKTIHGRKIFHTWEESEKLLWEKRIDVQPVVSHDLPMSKYKEAHEILIRGEGCKIMVNPQEF